MAVFHSSNVLAVVLMHAVIKKKKHILKLMFAAAGNFMCLLGQKEKEFVVNCAAPMLRFSSSMPIGWWKYISFLGRCFEN